MLHSTVLLVMGAGLWLGVAGIVWALLYAEGSRSEAVSEGLAGE